MGGNGVSAGDGLRRLGGLGQVSEEGGGRGPWGR